MGELNPYIIMCKRDTESAKVAPESVLSNRGISKVRIWPGFRRGGGCLRTPAMTSTAAWDSSADGSRLDVQQKCAWHSLDSLMDATFANLLCRKWEHIRAWTLGRKTLLF